MEQAQGGRRTLSRHPPTGSKTPRKGLTIIGMEHGCLAEADRPSFAQDFMLSCTCQSAPGSRAARSYIEIVSAGASCSRITRRPSGRE